eukprot:6192605-Pleurochrysis_carterae.AAC.3
MELDRSFLAASGAPISFGDYAVTHAVLHPGSQRRRFPAAGPRVYRLDADLCQREGGLDLGSAGVTPVKSSMYT